jgi:hypothetical protein
MTNIIAALLQGAAEYGALSGGQGVAGSNARGLSGLTDLFSEHGGLLLAAGAGLLLLWLVLRVYRRN